jgi:hypothetical protein
VPRVGVVGLLVGSLILVGCTGPSGGWSDDPGDAPSEPGALVWEAREGPGFVSDVVDADGRLVAIGSAATTSAASTPQAWTSMDGRTWDAAAVDGDGRMAGVARAEGGSLVAVGERATGNAFRAVAWFSPDGATWTVIDDDGEFDAAPGCASTTLEDVAAGPAGFVAVGAEWGEGSCGQHAAAWWSADGVNWMRAVDPGGHAMHAVVQTKDGFAAAGAGTADANEGARAAAWWSADGQAWTQADAIDGVDGFYGAEIKALAVDTHGVAAVGYSINTETGALAPAAWRSGDGLTWTRADAEGLAGVSAQEPAEPSGTGPGAVRMAYADGLIATDGGLIATGVATTMEPGADGSTTDLEPWRYQLWTATADESWARLPDTAAPIAGDGNVFVAGPRAIVFGNSLFLFGAVPDQPAADQAPSTGPPSLTTPTTWEIDALALGLGPDVTMNAWWKDAGGGGVGTGPIVDAGGPLSARNCPTLDEVRAAVPVVVKGPDANPEPFKGQVLLCSYTIGEMDTAGYPALVSIEVFDASVEGVEGWGSANEDPANPTAIPGLGDTATAKGKPGHEVVWVTSGPWALKLANSRQDGIPLDQMVALARTALTSVALPPR